MIIIKNKWELFTCIQMHFYEANSKVIQPIQMSYQVILLYTQMSDTNQLPILNAQIKLTYFILFYKS